MMVVAVVRRRRGGCVVVVALMMHRAGAVLAAVMVVVAVVLALRVAAAALVVAAAAAVLLVQHIREPAGLWETKAYGVVEAAGKTDQATDIPRRGAHTSSIWLAGRTLVDGVEHDLQQAQLAFRKPREMIRNDGPTVDIANR